MAPRRGRGGGGISFGGDGPSVDPATLANIFSYVMLGLFGLCYLYVLVAMIQKRQSIFLHNVIGLITLSYLFTVLGGVTDISLILAVPVFGRVGPVLAWLFALEPSRRIMNLQSSDPNGDKTSIFNIKQYFRSGGVGYALLLAYVYAFAYTICAIAYVADISINGLSLATYELNYFLNLSTWLLFLIWICLVCFVHHSLIPHVKSLYYYGFFLLCGIVSVTVLIATYETWYDSLGRVILNFVLSDVTLFFAIYTALRYGSKWFNITKFDLTPNQQS
ncbi:hypothetical protein BJ944DRAFT_253245 [Cunninghamella echinulata]|nr:hypothetical protein BJ944DRAFT_253245 [Cunninghamella echinulata]